MGLILFFIILVWTVVLLPNYIRFKSSLYQMVSGHTFMQTIFNKGNIGEFLTFNKLESLDDNYKLMTNLYIPKKDGTTTEIDLLMISGTGIYVFESKNYSGWIFGNEKHKNWTQTFKNGYKNQFFNPVWQNGGHINTLKAILEVENEALCQSYIVFSERCTLKDITVESPHIKVMKRNHLLRTLKEDIRHSPILLSDSQIYDTFRELLQYTRADESVKQAHIKAVQLKA